MAETAKRTLDVAAALAGLVLLAPVLAVVAVLVKLTSPGPVLFRQERIGRNFRPFTIYKFRTMVADAPRGGRLITASNDPRITPLGRLLRKTKLDELPQLWNVLVGDMSLVGPRPEVRRYVEMFRKDYEEILRVRPGITDAASIAFRNEAALLARSADPERQYIEHILPQKIALAKHYVRHASMAQDFGILLRTAWRLLADRLLAPAKSADQGHPCSHALGECNRQIAFFACEGGLQAESDQTLGPQPNECHWPQQGSRMNVPFFRVALNEAEIAEVVACLKSGWLTTGPRCKQFEAELAEFVGAKHAVAVNSCTAALHLAVEALGLRSGQAVLVPTMTFAATAEVVRYQGAVPLLVDCDPATLNIDLADAERKIADLKAGHTPLDPRLEVVGIIPVHYGGLMVDMDAVRAFAERHGLWVVEDAAHALPAAFRRNPSEPWRRCGENTATVTCFSFYANKTITTGEGGMATTNDPRLADRMRQMSLHGLSHDAWNRYSGGSWDYRIVAPGYKYNMTDLAASIGIHQLRRAEAMRRSRQWVAQRYLEAFGNLDQIELPPVPRDRISSWHLFPIRLRLEKLAIDRNAFIDQLKAGGVGCSVHWRPLHLHPYYAETFGWRPEHFPVASALWPRLVSLPLFPDLREEEVGHVIRAIRILCARHAAVAAHRPAA